MKQRIYYIIEAAGEGDRTSRIFDFFMDRTIVTSRRDVTMVHKTLFTQTNEPEMPVLQVALL